MRETMLQMGERLKSSKWDAHTYLPIYDELFTPMRDEPITIVEIGIDQGNSLLMWLEYFPRARIIGIDEGPIEKINNANRLHPRITAHMHRQEDLEVERIMGTFLPDIVIDDAGHNHDAQMICYFRCWPHVRPGGLYCIEDIQRMEHIPTWERLGAKVYANFTSSARQDYRYDDILVVFRKG